jgi:hypothetical protein
MFPELVGEKAVGPILPSVFVGSNADLIRAVAPFYLTGSVLDVTYGRGSWWRSFKPAPFTAHDLRLDGVDFTKLPEDDRSFDAVAFDPPYTISGAIDTSTAPDFVDRFGLGGQRRAAFYRLIYGGLDEVARVSRTYVLVKCMEFCQGRQFHDVPYEITDYMLDAGYRKHDSIVHFSGSGPGGHNIFDPVRARRHHSYLLVFKRTRRRRDNPSPAKRGTGRRG